MSILRLLRPRFRKLYDERFGLAHVKHVFEPMFHLFRYLGCELQCAVFSHTPAHHTLRSLLRFLHFFLVKLPPNCTCAFDTWSKNDVFFSPSEAKTHKNVPPPGRLQRSPLTSRGR